VAIFLLRFALASLGVSLGFGGCEGVGRVGHVVVSWCLGFLGCCPTDRSLQIDSRGGVLPRGGPEVLREPPRENPSPRARAGDGGGSLVHGDCSAAGAACPPRSKWRGSAGALLNISPPRKAHIILPVRFLYRASCKTIVKLLLVADSVSA
jgi:hypothetical protein